MTPDLSDEEIDRICNGYKQNAAKLRHLRALGLRVDQRPNGRPLVARIEWDRVYSAPEAVQQRRDPSNGPKWKISVNG